MENCGYTRVINASLNSLNDCCGRISKAGGMKMNTDDINELNFEEKKTSIEILHWCQGKGSFLNIVSPPYNTALIFIETILEYLRYEKKVLYITDEKHKYIEVIKKIKEYTNFKQYTYLNSNLNLSNYLLVFSGYKKAAEIKEEFDLVIYDDIRSYPRYSKIEIAELMNNCCKSDGKLISYSIEEVFKNQKSIFLNLRNNKIPIVEPRLITTRLDINKEMPYVVYEYVKWSINIGRRVIIPVPDKVCLFNVMSYVFKYADKLTRNIMYYSSEEKNVKAISEFRKFNDCIMVTDDFDSVCTKDEVANIIVFFADYKKYTYKKLTYFCGRTGKGGIKDRGEVLLLANEETNDIERAKNITRNFNKEAWESGLLRL